MQRMRHEAQQGHTYLSIAKFEWIDFVDKMRGKVRVRCVWRCELHPSHPHRMFGSFLNIFERKAVAIDAAGSFPSPPLGF